MSPKKKQPEPAAPSAHGHIEGAGQVVRRPITETLLENYMPYAMSVIVSRAIPEIDGFKPAHRKILYTMYRMGLLGGTRIKSANVVGQTMRLNPHGDAAIYETMVRLSRGYEALLVPYVDSKGNFGKAYSGDMKAAASRYTEVRLEKAAQELFRDIDKQSVDFVANYDNTMKEPTLLPVTFPSILVNANTGIAVGMASNICPFNLSEVCRTAAALLRDPDHDIRKTLLGPDFPGGGRLLYDGEALRKIYETGTGSFRVRCRYEVNPKKNLIRITEIPPTTTIEAVLKKLKELKEAGKAREISDARDASDISGLNITIDCKRGTDHEKLMRKLIGMTPLEDSFACNFNVLIGGFPRVLGVRELLGEWIAFRRGCVRRRVAFELSRNRERLHLLLGLEKILLDIDRAIAIIRHTEAEEEVVPNLMAGFGIDELQAEFVAEIKLRYLNRSAILKRTRDRDAFEALIADQEKILGDPKRIDALILEDLERVDGEYGKPRRTEILRTFDRTEAESAEPAEDYPVRLFYTREGYFKKIVPLSLRMSGEQNLKENDVIVTELDSHNGAHLLFFTNLGQVYKARVSDFADGKASALGDYVATALEMDPGETPAGMAVTDDFTGWVLFFFENGKAAKVALSCYETKTRRKKLLNACSTKSPLVALYAFPGDREYLLTSTASRGLIVDSALIAGKTTRNTQGVQVMKMSRKGAVLRSAVPYKRGSLEKENRLRARNLPSAGGILRATDAGEQLSLEI